MYHFFVKNGRTHWEPTWFSRCVGFCRSLRDSRTLGHARAKIPTHPPDVQKWPQTSVLGRFSLRNSSPTCFFSVFFGLRGSFGSLPLGTFLGHLKRLCQTHNQFKVKTLPVTANFCHTTRNASCHTKGGSSYARDVWRIFCLENEGKRR